MLSELPSFEYLSKLASEDPEKLEQIRAQQVENLIESAPQQYQRRLRGIQFQVDCARRKHNNPLAACIEISSMMYDSLHRLNKALTTPAGSSSEVEEKESADVLSFPAVAV